MKTKTILTLIIVIVIAGAFWYWNKGDKAVDNQTASVLENTGILGSPDAPVTMVDYSSHFCGHCIDYHIQTLPIIIEKYVKTGKVKYIFKPVSPPQIANAVYCAGDQDKFWEFSEYLFENASEIASLEALKKMAGDFGLNQDEFNQCVDSDKYQDEVAAVYGEAKEKEVTGTPTFFINDEKIIGNQPLEIFEQAINKALNQ